MYKHSDPSAMQRNYLSVISFPGINTVLFLHFCIFLLNQAFCLFGIIHQYWDGCRWQLLYIQLFECHLWSMCHSPVLQFSWFSREIELWIAWPSSNVCGIHLSACKMWHKWQECRPCVWMLELAEYFSERTFPEPWPTRTNNKIGH